MSPEAILAMLGVKDVVTVSDDNTVEEALKIINEKGIRAAPVIDKDGVFMGMFSDHEVIKNLVPGYMMDGLQSLDFADGSSPALASRLRKMFPSRVGDHVSYEDCVKITNKTNTWEALRRLVKYGSPLPVIDAKTKKLKGLISEQSALEALLQIEADDAEMDD